MCYVHEVGEDMTLPVGRAVKHFMDLMGQEIPDRPTMLDEATWELRTDLVVEEFKEIDEAYEAGDMAAFLDGCVDLVYVVVGMALAAGMPFDEAFDAVHRANMEKAPECTDCAGKGWVPVYGLNSIVLERPDCETCNGFGRIVLRREDGKILKPEGWKAPDIQSIIDAHAVG